MLGALEGAAELPMEELGDAASPMRRSGGVRPMTRLDPLYGAVRLAAWTAAMIATPPFRRLAGVSLSDVPGTLLFGGAFPSRLDHTLGVYHLARVARPRDRALQVAALAHDLGHGPFSHLTEPLMRERLGIDHEQRSVRLLAEVRAALPGTITRGLATLDWDEVGQLVLGQGDDGRGELLNGLLDYDNADNIARFLLASGLGQPSYDPVALTRALHTLPEAVPLPQGTVPASAEDLHAPTATEALVGSRGMLAPVAQTRVYLDAAAATEAENWRHDRARVYTYLHDGHRNLAAHAMLRKAIDLAAAADALPPDFFALDDDQALRLLARVSERGAADLAGRVSADRLYSCAWEAEVPAGEATVPALLRRWRERLALEARLAGEAGLMPREVVVEALVSSAQRMLPPFATPSRFDALRWAAMPSRQPLLIHIFVAPEAQSDYVRRLCMAAERHFGPLGAVAVAR